VEALKYELHFLRYVRDAFSPVGLMLDFWAEHLPCGVAREIKVVLINDHEDRWQGDVRLQIVQGDRIVRSQSQSSAVDGLGRTVLTFTESIPEQPGDYTLVAEFTGPDGQPVQSLRDFRAKHSKE